MKYILLIYGDEREWGSMSQDEMAKVYAAHGAYGEAMVAAGVMRGGYELQPVTTATTVTHSGGAPVVTDGPFSEAKEVIGGFSVVDVPDLDAAIALAKSWPMLELEGTSVEIRPMVTDYSQFEQ